MILYASLAPSSSTCRVVWSLFKAMSTSGLAPCGALRTRENNDWPLKNTLIQSIDATLV